MIGASDEVAHLRPRSVPLGNLKDTSTGLMPTLFFMLSLMVPLKILVTHL